MSIYPQINESAFIGPFSSVIGDVKIEENVFVAANVVLRADNLLEVPKQQSDFSEKVIKVNVELSDAYNLKFGDTRCSCGLCCNHNSLIHN